MLSIFNDFEVDEIRAGDQLKSSGTFTAIIEPKIKPAPAVAPASTPDPSA